jgi:hypothetical protein
VRAEVHTDIRMRIPFFGNDEDFHMLIEMYLGVRRLSTLGFGLR